MNKKIFNLIFISSLFLVLLTLFSVQTAKAYQVGDVVSFAFTRVGCGTGNSAGNIDWYGTPAYFERKIIPPCVNGEVPMIITTKITSPGGCKVNGCGADPGVECVTKKYASLHTYTDNVKEPVGVRNLIESCKKCNAEVTEVVEVINYSTGITRRIYDKIVTKNKCAKYKTDGCPNPCPETCPAQKCEEIDKNGDGDAEDEYDYKCVVEVATAAAATAPIARETPTATAAGGGGGAVLGVTTIPESGAKCCDLVANNNFSSCPAGNTASCCPSGWSCKPDGVKKAKKAICCSPSQKFESVPGAPDYCNNNTCPPINWPDKSKPCTGSLFSACCKQNQPCGTFDVYKEVLLGVKIPLGTVGYCKTAEEEEKCPAGTTVDFCAGLCCQTGQKCETKNGIKMCLPESPAGCNTAKGETYCPGEDQFELIKICCDDGEACIHHPNGYPYCYPAST